MTLTLPYPCSLLYEPHARSKSISVSANAGLFYLNNDLQLMTLVSGGGNDSATIVIAVGVIISVLIIIAVIIFIVLMIHKKRFHQFFLCKLYPAVFAFWWFCLLMEFKISYRPPLSINLCTKLYFKDAKHELLNNGFRWMTHIMFVLSVCVVSIHTEFTLCSVETVDRSVYRNRALCFSFVHE